MEKDPQDILMKTQHPNYGQQKQQQHRQEAKAWDSGGHQKIDKRVIKIISWRQADEKKSISKRERERERKKEN